MITSWVDTAIASRLSISAIAAVGISSFFFFFLFSFANGFSIAIQRSTVVEHVQNGNRAGTKSLVTGLSLSVIVSAIFAAAVFPELNAIFHAISPDRETALLAETYMKPLVYSLPFFYINTAFRGYLNASELSGVYMRNNLTIQIVNIVVSIPLSFGYFRLPQLGIAGIGYGTMIAYIVGTISYITSLIIINRNERLVFCKPKLEEMIVLTKASFIAGAGLNLYALGWVISFWIVGHLGQVSVAVYQIIAQVTLFPIYIANSFGTTVVNLVSTALAERNFAKAYSDGIRVPVVAGLITFLYALPLAFLSRWLLLLVSDGGISAPYFTYILAGSVLILPIYTIGVVMSNAVQATDRFGRAFVVAFSSQWLVFLPLSWALVIYMGYGLLGILISEFAYRSMVVIAHSQFWFSSEIAQEVAS